MSRNFWIQEPIKSYHGFGDDFVHVSITMPKEVARAITKIAFELDMNRSRYLCCLCIAAVKDYEDSKQFINPEKE